MKQDFRTTRTLIAIKKAFIGLLQKKPFTKITVSEIARNAYIDRQTFYLHYTDKYDLLDHLVKEVVEQTKPIFNERMQEGAALKKVELIYQNHAAYFHKNKLLINSLLQIDTGNICLKRDLQKIFIKKYERENNRKLTSFQADIMSTLYVQSLIAFLDDEQQLNIKEVEDLQKMIREFIQ
ncbi:MAG: TetR/AcrR family transcriptional regulator [Lactobacillus sp.]